MKIFYLTSRIPYPIDKGDKLRAYHQLRLLSEQHEVYLMSLDDECKENVEFEKLKELAAHVKVIKLTKKRIFLNILRGFFSKIPFQNSFYFSQKIKKVIQQEVLDFNPDLIFCQLIRMSEYVINDSKNVKILDYIDVLSKGLERRKTTSNLFMKPVLYLEHKKVLNYESVAYNKFKNAIIITENDKEALQFNHKDNVKVIPNGIDIKHYSKLKIEKDIDLLFAGNMSYAPNVDAALYFVENVLPGIIKIHPNIKFYIAGASPSSRVKKIGNKNIVVTGWVEDIREYYSRAKVFVAPMQIGTGMQNKILEAMSMELPCVISSIAQGGIQAIDEENILIADTSEEFASKVIKLLSNKEYADKIGTNARSFVSKNFNWDSIGKKLNDYLSSTFNNSQ